MDNATRATLSKGDLKILQTYEFVKRTDERALRRKIQDLVDLAKQVRKEELAEKRERLRELLAKEESEFEQEYMVIVQAKVHNDILERQNRLMEIQREHDRENEAAVQLKKVQQYINNCDDIRHHLRKNMLNDTKWCQLQQIEEKRRKAIEDLEHERVWEEVAKKQSDEKARIEECKELERKKRILDDQKFLNHQVLEVRWNQEQMRQEELEARLKAEEKLKAELELERRALAGEAGRKLQKAKEIQAELLEAMEVKKKRMQDEIAFDRMFQEAIDAQYKREQEELAAKVNTLREATLTYLNYLRELKKERAMKDYEFQKALRDFEIKANEKKDKQWRESKEKKAAAAKKAHEELLAQICENQIQKMKEKDLECLEAQKANERWECEFRRDIEKQKQREEFAMNYGKELQEQVAAIRAYKAEQEKLFEVDLDKAKQDDEFCQSLLAKFMSGEANYLRAHPNWSLLKCSCLEK